MKTAHEEALETLLSRVWGTALHSEWPEASILWNDIATELICVMSYTTLCADGEGHDDFKYLFDLAVWRIANSKAVSRA